MVYKINIFKIIILFCILLFLSAFAFLLKGNVETNLLRTLLPQSIISSTNIVPVADKSSSVIKVVFEAEDDSSLENLKNSFINNVSKDFFEIYKPDFSSVLAQYILHPENFLSQNTRKLLKDKKYDEVYAQSLERLYSPAEIQLTTLDKDPYSLVNDFIMSNRQISEADYNIGGKYYDYLTLKIRTNQGLSPELTHGRIAELVSLQKKLSINKQNVYLSGSPVHSFYTRKQSITDINIICILSVLVILTLTYFYFKNIKLLLPVIISIGTGMLAGYCATKLWFTDFQIITMVFSTTLIGIGIDYSFHYFFSEKSDKSFVKNLTFSLLTTVVPFAVLYFTGIELLKQISVFTVFGLIAIYFVVLIFYPVFGNIQPQRTVKPNRKVYCIILIMLCILSLIGFFRLKFNDSLNALYSPNDKLKKAEAIYNKVSGENNINTQIITVKANNINKILLNEEKIADELNNVEIVSLAKFMPSESRQKENFELVKDLYNNNLQNYTDILSQKQINFLKNISYSSAKFDMDSFLSEFMLDDNTSLMFVFSNSPVKITGDNISIVNIKTDIQKYLKDYRKMLIKVSPIVVCILMVILVILYGIKRSVKIIIPPLSGIICSVGLTCLILGEMNLFGIIACFLVLGFTMDYSIFRTDSQKQTEDAVFISSFTTMVSFLLLSLCGIKLLSSIALVLFFGILISYLTGFLLFNGQSNQMEKSK